MAITLPTDNTVISTTTFGLPVANQLNGLAKVTQAVRDASVTTVNTDANGDWTVTVSGYTPTMAIAIGNQPAYPSVQVLNSIAGSVVKFRSFGNGGGPNVSTTIGVAYLIIGPVPTS